MATSSNNNIKKSIAPKSLFDDMQSLLDSTISFNQGDLLYLDTSAHLIKPIAAEANTQTLLGVARETVVSGKLKSPYSTATDAAEGIGAVAGPLFGIEVELTLNTGDALNPGELVYPAYSVDAQTVTATDNGANHDPCGVYNGPAISSASAGQKIVVMLGCGYPARVLKF